MSDNNDHFEKICEFCGAECWFDEMKTHEKCWTCYVQDCKHLHIDRMYMSSDTKRAIFQEECCTCDSVRSVFLYFDFDYDSYRTKWTNENVSQGDMEWIQQ